MRRIGGFDEQVASLGRIGARSVVGAQALGMGEKHSIAKFGEGLSFQTNVMGEDTVVAEDDFPVFIIYGRQKKGIAHGKAGMLPTAIDLVIVVIIDTSYAVGHLCRLVVIDGS